MPSCLLAPCSPAWSASRDKLSLPREVVRLPLWRFRQSAPAPVLIRAEAGLRWPRLLLFLQPGLPASRQSECSRSHAAAFLPLPSESETQAPVPAVPLQSIAFQFSPELPPPTADVPPVRRAALPPQTQTVRLRRVPFSCPQAAPAPT